MVDDASGQLHIVQALNDGQVKPLVDFLRSGEPVSPFLAHHLADMLDGKSRVFNFPEPKRTRQNGPTGTEIANKSMFHWAIGVDALERSDLAAKGESESALSETMARFRVGRSTVAACRADVIKMRGDLPAEIWQGWLASVRAIDAETIAKWKE